MSQRDLHLNSMKGAQFLAAVAAAATLFQQCMGGLILAKSDLDVCLNTGDPGAIKCQKKILVTLTVPSGQTGEESALLAEVRDPTSKTGKQVLTKPIKITISKTASVVQYPLSYIQDVNGDPFEQVIFKRKDCQVRLNERASCGVVKDSRGSLIPGSQGFCCQCEKFKGYKYFRGQPQPSNCKGASDPGYAFCLRYGSIWYQVYRVGLGTMTFEIAIQTDDQKGGVRVIRLSPARLSSMTMSRQLIASLAGDLASYTQIPHLEGKYFNFPKSTQAYDKWRQFTSQNPQQDRNLWLILDGSRYAFPGMTCDKIGLSYEGYQRQSQTCNGKMGMCIGEQILDFLKEDKAARDQGRQSIHAVSKYGTPKESSKESMTIQVAPTISIIVLELAADSVSFQKNKSPGKILEVGVPAFEAMSTAGTLTVVVENNGGAIASYGLYVLCTGNIVSIPGQTLTLAPAMPSKIQLPVRTQNSDASKYKCIATLRDSEGELVDQKSAEFATTVTQFNNGTQGSGVEVGRPKNDTASSGKKFGFGIGGIFKKAFRAVTAPFRAIFGAFDNLLGKCSNCPGAVDVGCFIKHFCVKKIMAFVGIVVGIALAIYLVLLLQSMGLLSPICGCCCLPLKVLLSMRPPSGGAEEEAQLPVKSIEDQHSKTQSYEEVDYDGLSSLFDEEEPMPRKDRDEEHLEEEEEGNDDEEEGEEEETDV